MAEVARLKAAAEETKKARVELAVEVSSSKKANGKLKKELTFMTQKLKEVKGDRNDFERL